MGTAVTGPALLGSLGLINFTAASSTDNSSDTKTMPNLPLEIFDNIFFFCSTRTLFNCLTLSQNHVGIAIIQLYRSVPTRYSRQVEKDGKLERESRATYLFSKHTSTSLPSDQDARLLQYRHAVREIDDVDNVICNKDRLPALSEIVQKFPRLGTFRWVQKHLFCHFSLSRNEDGEWNDLYVNAFNLDIWYHGGGIYLKSLTKATKTAVTSLAFYDTAIMEPYDENDSEYSMSGDMDIGDSFFGFIGEMEPHFEQLRFLHIGRAPVGRYGIGIGPVAELLPETLVRLILERRTIDDIEEVLGCTLPKLEHLEFSLDTSEKWTYTSKSGAPGKTETSPKLKTVLFLVRDIIVEEYGEDGPIPPSAGDMGAWLADTFPPECDVSVEFEPEGFFIFPTPFCRRWIEDVKGAYLSHRTA